MRNSRFQNHVSESSITLPLCMVIGTLVWFWDKNSYTFNYNLPGLAVLVMVMLTTYVVLETANAFAILRIRSRMITAVWVTGISLMSFTHSYSVEWLAVLALAGSHYIMFLTYQQHQPIAHIFHTFVLLGIGSLIIPQLLVFVPMYYWYLLVFMRALTWRGFWAGIVGMVLPISFVLAFCILRNDFSLIWNRIDILLTTKLFATADYSWLLSYKNPETLVFVFISILSFIGIIHYLRNNYNDNIRTRMYLYIYAMQTIGCWLMIICSPDIYHQLAPILMISSSTMIAHFFALTGSVISNIFFILSVITTILLLTLNIGVWSF